MPVSRKPATILKVINALGVKLHAENCGEDYVDEAVTRALMQSAEDMVASGAQVDIRKYAAEV